jgi:MoaA/NifB/PqqE/SkfB family radical SAM enzyme
MVYAHFGLTHRCNLRCRMCGVRLDARLELPLEKLAVAARSLKELGVFCVSLSGGEPLLREDLAEIVRLFCGMDFDVRVLTNGTLAREPLIRRLADAGLREVSVSLHSLDPEKQDSINGTSGSHAAILESLRLFARALQGPGRILLINTVVSPVNIAELPALAAFAARSGYQVSFVPIENQVDRRFEFTERDHPLINDVYARLAALKREKGSAIFNSTRFLEQSRQYLVSGRRAWRCEAGQRYCSVNPAGELSICHRFPAEGSVLDSDWPRRLRSRAFQRRRQAQVSACPGCLRPCWAEITNFFSDPACVWEMARNKLGRRPAPQP